MAPVKVAVLPLVRKDGQPDLAHEVRNLLRGRMQTEYDEGGSIGRRYRRQDEIGTPYCVTIDHQSLEDRTVTVRDRDTLAQDRVAIDELADVLAEQARRALDLAEARSPERYGVVGAGGVARLRRRVVGVAGGAAVRRGRRRRRARSAVGGAVGRRRRRGRRALGRRASWSSSSSWSVVFVVSVLSFVVAGDVLRLTGTNVVRCDDDVDRLAEDELGARQEEAGDERTPRGRCRPRRARAGAACRSAKPLPPPLGPDARCTRRWAAAAAGIGGARAPSRSPSRSPARPSATGS